MCTVCARPAAARPQRRNAWPGSRDARPARRRPAAYSCGPRATEAGPGAVPAQRSGARGDDRTCTQSCLHGTAGGEWLWHEPQQGLHHENPRRTTNLPDMVESSSSKRGGWAMEGRSSPAQLMMLELNGRDDVT
jgi:hypothetical protein